MRKRWPTRFFGGYKSHGAENDGVDEGAIASCSFAETGAAPAAPGYKKTLCVNLCAGLIPGVYATLSKLWVASIDAALLATTEVYTYIGVVGEVINEGLPRAAWCIIADRSKHSFSERVRQAKGLIVIQAILGLCLSLLMFALASQFAAAFVPSDVRSTSLTYVRVSAFAPFVSAVEVAVFSATRALDRPDIPLVINSVKFALNIVIDFLFISTFRVWKGQPNIVHQAAAQLACSALSASAGLIYFSVTTARRLRSGDNGFDSAASDGAHSGAGRGASSPESLGLKAWVSKDSFKGVAPLLAPGLLAFASSAVNNALYLWLVNTIVGFGALYASAWGVFNTMRWGIVMVPTAALEAVSLTFVGHRWGELRLFTAQRKTLEERPKTKQQPLAAAAPDVAERSAAAAAAAAAVSPPPAELARKMKQWGGAKYVMQPALRSALVALVLEFVLYLAFSFLNGANKFAMFISSSDREVSDITTHMWKTIDWCYIFYAVGAQLAAIILATRPKYFFYQTLASNAFWVLPWIIIVQVVGTKMKQAEAWTFHALAFGGSLVFSFFVVSVTVALWTWSLARKNGGDCLPDDDVTVEMSTVQVD